MSLWIELLVKIVPMCSLSLKVSSLYSCIVWSVWLNFLRFICQPMSRNKKFLWSLLLILLFVGHGLLSMFLLSHKILKASYYPTMGLEHLFLHPYSNIPYLLAKWLLCQSNSSLYTSTSTSSTVNIKFYISSS